MAKNHPHLTRNLVGFFGVEIFHPNYQTENPGKFKTLLEKVMNGHRFDHEHINLFGVLKNAIKFVNHHMMLDKLGVGAHEDQEALHPAEFKKEFERLARLHPMLIVVDGKINPKEKIGTSRINELFERIWDAANRNIAADTRRNK